MNYPTGTWQELNWNPLYSSNDFWDFCSNITNVDAPKTVIEIDYALSNYTGGEPWTNLGNYANYIKSVLIPLCDGEPIDSTSCFGTQNETYYADVTNGAGRSYLYTGTQHPINSPIQYILTIFQKHALNLAPIKQRPRPAHHCFLALFSQTIRK